jgi:hypothetical protein
MATHIGLTCKTCGRTFDADIPDNIDPTSEQRCPGCKAHFVAGTDELRAATGAVTSDDPFVAFIYTLGRDHLPFGKIAEIMKDIGATAGKPYLFTNGWLADYSKYIVSRLRRGIDIVNINGTMHLAKRASRGNFVKGATLIDKKTGALSNLFDFTDDGSVFVKTGENSPVEIGANVVDQNFLIKVHF